MIRTYNFKVGDRATCKRAYIRPCEVTILDISPMRSGVVVRNDQGEQWDTFYVWLSPIKPKLKRTK